MNSLRRKLLVPIIVLVSLSLTAVLLAPAISVVHAPGSPAMTIQPSTQGAKPVNSLLTFNVTVQNMPFTFAGWDITVVTDNTVLSPQSITLCNTTACNVQYSDSGGTNFMPGGTDAQCINGTPSGAFNTCGGNDGPGVAHDAFASSGFTGGALLLFTITYKVMSSGNTNIVLGPSLTQPESTTGTTNHLLDNNGIDIIADETVGFYGTLAPSLISVVEASGGALFASQFAGAWSTWQSLSGTSNFAPAVCSSGAGSAELVVTGIDGQLYHKSFSSGSWAATWDAAGGRITGQPACAVLNGVLYVVARAPDAPGSLWTAHRPLPTGAWSSWG